MGGLKGKPWIPAENDDVIYEQPLTPLNPVTPITPVTPVIILTLTL